MDGINTTKGIRKLNIINLTKKIVNQMKIITCHLGLSQKTAQWVKIFHPSHTF